MEIAEGALYLALSALLTAPLLAGPASQPQSRCAETDISGVTGGIR